MVGNQRIYNGAIGYPQGSKHHPSPNVDAWAKLRPTNPLVGLFGCGCKGSARVQSAQIWCMVRVSFLGIGTMVFGETLHIPKHRIRAAFKGAKYSHGPHIERKVRTW